jgi:23S rRNA (uracil1939-C5)-methyltransferase
MLSPGAELILVPEKAVAGGSMLARHEGRVIFVRGGIPGERVLARVERVSRDSAHAAAIDVIEPHADRRPPAVDPVCGGNAFAHIAYNRQLSLKAEIIADAFARLARLPAPHPISVAPSPERGYRMRARFHVRGKRAGFYREGTHELCDPATSGQLQPEAIEAVQVIARSLHEASVESGDVLAIELAENIAADMRAVHLELRTDRRADRLTSLGTIEGLTGLSWSLVSHARTQVVAGSPYVLDGLDLRPLEVPGASAVPGAPLLSEGAGPSPDLGRFRIAPASLDERRRSESGERGPHLESDVQPLRLRRHVRAFFQGNRYLLSELVGRVLSLIPEGPVIDLYAGVGLFAVALASTRPDQVVAVEGEANSAADLTANAGSCRRPFSAHHLSVEEFLRQSRGMPSHTMVLDPPRTGLSHDAAASIDHHAPQRIVYVSCDVATLARDVKIFSDAGYRLVHVEAFDLFPNTAHIETIAVLDRQ